MRRELDRARARMAEVRKAILHAETPGDISACVPLIEDATAALRSVAHWRAEPDLMRDFEKLQSELRLAEKLIAGGTEFYRGWWRMLSPDAASYTRSGAGPAAAAPGTVSVLG